MTASSQSPAALMRWKKADLVEEVLALRRELEANGGVADSTDADGADTLPGADFFSRDDRSGLWPVLEASPVGISIIRPEGEILYVNASLAELVGVQQHEAVGRDTRDLFFDPADRDRYLAKVEREGGVRNLEREIRRADGRTFWVSLTTQIHEMNGETVWVTWVHDVTEERRHADMLRDLLDTVPCTVVVSSAETNELLYVNEFAQNTTGLLTTAYKNPADREELVKRLRRDGRVNDFEAELYSSDGTAEWILIAARMMEFDGQQAALTVSQVITERKRTEEALQGSEARLLAILESSPIGVSIVQLDGTIHFANSRMAELTGRTKEQLMQTRARELWADPEDRNRVIARLEQEGSLRDVEALMRRANGSDYLVLFSFEPTTLDDGSKAYFAWAYDITERKRAETELAQKEALLSTALTSMSDGIFVFDSDMRLVMFNDRYAEMMSVPPDTLKIGRWARESIGRLAELGFYGPGDPETQADERFAAFVSDEYNESELTTPEGRILHVRKAPLKDGGAVSTTTDINRTETHGTGIARERGTVRMNHEQCSRRRLPAHHES